MKTLLELYEEVGMGGGTVSDGGSVEAGDGILGDGDFKLPTSKKKPKKRKEFNDDDK